ncbi:hypothetical protein SAMN05660649_00916 [Desulfotomaculum arcticum]|uniref:Non-ribosomal peptide synthetase module n=1 Tax=Desulfotruncus arcticus DSM 17038 TaxID=1121424 RepID=A0A1I2PIE2_9FIRM|nr:DUF6063 family protein [Desulfotruncus arcticus]SFG15824.1 hypothetical protein SAMN05660649_00916 [Desulfotomaculum arcticum] [Desulfotruncus arcticus DSM 17038]
MLYEQEQIIQAFRLFSKLSIDGKGSEDELRLYFSDDQIRGLVDQFAQEVECTIISAGDNLYFVPLALSSPHHIKNETLKRTYLKANSTNNDIYLMYVSIVVLFGAFYNSYQTIEPTIDFISMSEWLKLLDERLQALKEHDRETLAEAEKDYKYNWCAILEKWDALDDLKETAKTQDKRTNSRLGFLDSVKRFLEAQELVHDIGNFELELTEKAKTIIQRYYMEIEYNRGILEFMYQLEEKKGEAEVAGNL